MLITTPKILVETSSLARITAGAVGCLAAPSKQQGVTITEIMVSVSVLAIIMTIGIPSVSMWMQNTQIRSTAESILTGLQLARAEAVRQNIRTSFQFSTPAGNSCNSKACWTVTSDSFTAPGTFPVSNVIQTSGASEYGQHARLGVSGLAVTNNACATTIVAGKGMATNPLPGVVFNPFGQIATDSSATTEVTTITRIDVTNILKADAKRLVINISPSGTAKMCDPSLPATNSRGCPTTCSATPP
jgi:type IV fimbrial biogenesis protein FimT